MRQIHRLMWTALIGAFPASAAPAELQAGRGPDEIPAAVAAGRSGSVYVAGLARGRDRGIYVAKIDAGGTTREFTAHLSGSGESVLKAIAVDREGNAYIVGHTNSADFPVFGGAEGKRIGGMDAFVAKLDAKGKWVYSTLLGGSGNDVALAVAVDGSGDVYVTGWTASTDFPADGAKLGQGSGFVVRVRAGAPVYGTLFGGREHTVGNGIAVDAEGAMYIAGSAEERGRSDAFLLKLNGRGEQVYRSLLSGSGDQAALAVALAEDGGAWIAGWTGSSDFPVNRGGEFGGGRDAFVARFDPDGMRTFSKVVGGKSDDEAHGLAVDSQGNVYLAGVTRSQDFPLDAAPAQAAAEARSFAMKLSAGGERVLLSEPLGSILPGSSVRMAVDTLGNATLTGNGREGGAVRRVATCRYRLSKALQSFDAGGGDASVLMDAPPECGWIAESNSSWIAATRLGDRFEFRALPNDTGGPRAGTVAAGGQTLIILQAGKGDWSRSAITGAIRANAGFRTSTVSACDDCSAAVTPLGFSINFFGNTYNQIYVNNNGNVTFDSANSSYTPNSISAIRRVLIAPFWADVDTRGTGSGLTTYGADTVGGRRAFGVNWVDVGYYSSKTNKLNSAQLVLIDRGDLGVGFFDIELNYASIQWETGDASGGTNGLGGNSARAGFSNGSGTAGTFFELPGSGVNGAFLNTGPNSLAANSTNSGGVAGRYVYNVRAGAIVCGTGITPTSASLATGGAPVTVNVTASNTACTWNVTALPPWISVSTPAGGNGTGSAAVTLQVAANSGAPRSAVITIAGQSFSVTQAGTSTPATCPPFSFLRGADVSMLGGNTSQGSLAGLERLLDGSMTLHNFTGNTTSYVQSSIPQFQQVFTNCIGRPPTTPTPPQNYRLLAETRGTSAVNPLITDLAGNGISSSVGVGSYSLDSARLQVWNATSNKTPGAKANYDIPANPQKLLSADLNGDSKRDIVLISQGATGGTQGVLSVLPGNGDGTLGLRRDTNVGNNPQSAALFDFNQDNKLDAAVANTGSNNVMILNGNGDATFQPPVTLSGDAPSPRAIAAADLNKDGRGDLMIGHSDGVDIRLGNGNGSFQPPVRVARGFVATSVASGDFNKDGNPDIAVSSETSSSATILLGNGNGTFGPPGSYVTRAGAGPFFVTDFDSDGNSDVVFGAGHPDGITAAANDSNVTVLYGRGNGTLHAAPSVVLPSLGEFTVGDFNGDGVPDVAATAPLTNGLSNTAGLNLAFNDGNGTLTPQSPIPVPSQVAPAQLSRITSADFNGDGRRDVAVTSGGIVHVLTANGAGGFNAPASFTASSQMTSITAADVNGDNRQDLVFTDEGEDSVSVALGNGNGTFQTRTIMNAGVDPKGAVAADVNGDGRPDLIVVNFGTAGNDSVPGGISVLLGGGSGAFQAAANFAAGLHPTNVTVGDVNLDGRPDIIVSTGGANAATLVGVLLGNGNGTFQTPTLLPAGFGPAQTALTDFNGDGKVDILVGHCCGSVQMGLLLGDGNGAFQTETTIPNTGNGSSFVVVTDMNRDGKPDVVFGANGSPGGYVATLLNVTSTGPLVPTINSPASGTAFGPGSITFSWGAVAGATKYKLEIGSTAGASDLFTQETTNTSLVVSNLPTDGRTLYTRVSAYVNGAYGSAATSIYQAFRTAVALRFVPVVPCRIADTRNATGVFGGPVISGGTTRDFPVPASPCGIPAGAQAYSLSVTVVPRGPLSYLTIWPTGQGQPFVSTLNSFDGRIKANAAIVPSGINGAVSVFVTNTTDVILDINGYFIPASGASNLSFYPLVPCRIADTRNASGQFGGPTMTAGQTRTFNVPQSACNLPSSAQAYSLNFTVVPPAGLSFLTTWPTGQSRPLVSTLNSFTGTVVANAAIVPAGTNGGIDVFVTDNTHVIIDVNGYFAPPGGAGAMSFYTATPCRVADTRLPVGPVGGPSMTAAQTRTFPVPSSSCGIPASAQAYSLNATVVPPANLSFLTLWPAGGAQPNVSTLNSFDGSVVANAAIVPAGVNGGINAFVTHLTDLILDINGFFAP